MSAQKLLDIATREYRAVKQVSVMDADLAAFKSVMETAGLVIDTYNIVYATGEISLIAKNGEFGKLEKYDVHKLAVDTMDVKGIAIRFRYAVNEWEIPENEHANRGVPRLHATNNHDERVILNTLSEVLGTKFIECTVENESRDATGHKHYAILESMPKWRLQLHFTDYEANTD